MKNIEQFITLVPNLIIYIVPGYIILSLIKFIIQKEHNRDKVTFIQYLVISYVIKISFEFIYNTFIQQYFIINELQSTFVLIIISFILGIIIGIFAKSSLFHKCLKRVGINFSIHNNVFDDINDTKYGEILRVYSVCRNYIYEGILRKFENSKNFDDIHIMLSEYIKYKNVNDKELEKIDDYSEDSTA